MVRCLAFAALLVLALQAEAADPGGKYAVDGVGRLDCARFAAAHDEGGQDLRMFAGWIDGYISGLNHLQPDTFDLTPWQTTELIAAKLDQYCQANPEAAVVEAVNRLVLVLTPDRLTSESEIVRLRRNDQAVHLYTAQVARIEARLAELGLDPGSEDATFDEALSNALMRFQRDRDLPQSGLPDQPTLNALFP